MSLFSFKKPKHQSSFMTKNVLDLYHVEEWLGNTVQYFLDINSFEKEQVASWGECSKLFENLIAELDKVCAIMKINVTHLTFEPNFKKALELVLAEVRLILDEYEGRQFRKVDPETYNIVKASLEKVNSNAGTIYSKVMNKRSINKRRF